MVTKMVEHLADRRYMYMQIDQKPKCVMGLYSQKLALMLR